MEDLEHVQVAIDDIMAPGQKQTEDAGSGVHYTYIDDFSEDNPLRGMVVVRAPYITTRPTAVQSKEADEPQTTTAAVQFVEDTASTGPNEESDGRASATASSSAITTAGVAGATAQPVEYIVDWGVQCLKCNSAGKQKTIYMTSSGQAHMEGCDEVAVHTEEDNNEDDDNNDNGNGDDSSSNSNPDPETDSDTDDYNDNNNDGDNNNNNNNSNNGDNDGDNNGANNEADEYENEDKIPYSYTSAYDMYYDFGCITDESNGYYEAEGEISSSSDDTSPAPPRKKTKTSNS